MAYEWRRTRPEGRFPWRCGYTCTHMSGCNLTQPGMRVVSAFTMSSLCLVPPRTSNPTCSLEAFGSLLTLTLSFVPIFQLCTVGETDVANSRPAGALQGIAFSREHSVLTRASEESMCTLVALVSLVEMLGWIERTVDHHAVLFIDFNFNFN